MGSTQEDRKQAAGLQSIDGQVFADELEAIVARREAVARRPDPGGSVAGTDTAEALRDAIAARRGDDGDPSGALPDPELGLVGLSLSGGGIRSATFNLGVLQVFAKRGLLRWFDYLSTVSGGGYLGATVSSTLLFETEGAAGAEAPLGASLVHRMGRPEPELIKHLRSGRDYLAPGGGRELARIPAVLLRGIVVNLLVVAPLIGLLAVITAVAPPFGVYFHQFEFTGFSAEQLGRGDVVLENGALFFLPTLLAVLLFVAWSALFPLVGRSRRRADWARRNRFELGFSTLLLLIGGVGLANLLPFVYYIVFNGTFESSPPWRIFAASVAAVLPVATSLRNAATRSASFDRLVDQLKLLAAGLLGPLILLSMYLGMALLVLDPLTVPLGSPDSALNVAVQVLPGELTRPTADILERSPASPYTRWANDLWDRIDAAGPSPDRGAPFYTFLSAAMGRPDADLAGSLRHFKRQFRPALALRLSPLGMRIFGDNRFVGPLRKNLEIDPATGRPFESVTVDELLFPDQTGPDRVLHLAHASEELRKDLVLTHSAILLALMGAIFLYVAVFVNINEIGLHRFYRDRLSRAYLFDPADPDGATGRADDLRLSQIDPGRSGAPYHLINATLNIPATEIVDLQGRASDFYIMSPRWCGSSATGYTRTREIEENRDRNLTLATAFAISGGAASPYMGVHPSRSRSLVMALLNIRLDYWAANPPAMGRAGVTGRVPGPAYLLREITGRMTSRTPFVNLSDGGHIENLGLYQLLRRRCKYIVACDAEQDPALVMSSLGRLTGYARMDDGVWIDWGGTLERLHRDAATGFSHAHWAVGRIWYGGQTGRIVYLKSSMCGNEWPDQLAYRAVNPDFPQQSTGEQFFNEEQFEAYRALGYLIASQLFADHSYRVDDLEAWFDRLEELAAPRYGGSADRGPAA